VNINVENVCQLLESAGYLSVLGLLGLCRDFLRNMLAPENCTGIMRFARDYCSGLEGDARSFVMSNSAQVSQQSEKRFELPSEELQAITGADELNMESEEVGWDGILRWISHDPENGKGNIMDLVKKIRLGLLVMVFPRRCNGSQICGGK
jgi:kelch-like protein 10